MEDNKKTGYGKIFAIVFAVVMGVCAVLWFAAKLYRKYCRLEHDDEELDGLDGESEKDCEVVIDTETETEEEAKTEVAPDAEQPE